MRMVNIGEPAPDFAAPDENNETVRLSQFRGKKVLLAFFPFAFSPVCTKEHTCFQEDMAAFSRLGVKVLGISVDSHWTQHAFKKSLGIDFPLLSDFSKDIAKKYGVLRPEGFSERAYFLINKDGVVSYKHIMATPSAKLENEELLGHVKKNAV